jgi:hypothetical protein
MNGAFVHLSINHIPVVGFPLCFLLLLAGNIRQSRDLVQAGYVGLVLIALVAVPTWYSGGPAARILKGNPDVQRSAIHEHAEAADWGAGLGSALGVLGLIGWWLSRRPEGAPKMILGMALLGSLFVSVVMGRIAHLGGLIRHPEIEADPNAPAMMMQMTPKEKPAQ